MPSRPGIPRPTAARVSLYLRELERRLEQGQATIRSRELGHSLGLTDTQVRKDLGHIGHLGFPGVGYRIEDLIARLRFLSGTDRGWRTAVVGVGNVGRALLSYDRFETEGFRIVAAFDSDPRKVGTRVGDHEISSMDRLGEFVQDRGIRIAIVATPPDAAQDAADALVEAGISGILNFAPRRLEVPPPVVATEVDLGMSLLQLALQVRIATGDLLEIADESSKTAPMRARSIRR